VKRLVRAMLKLVSPGGYGTLFARSLRTSSTATANGLYGFGGGGPVSVTWASYPILGCLASLGRVDEPGFAGPPFFADASPGACLLAYPECLVLCSLRRAAEAYPSRVFHAGA
jgi:hypothetical protein